MKISPEQQTNQLWFLSTFWSSYRCLLQESTQIPDRHMTLKSKEVTTVEMPKSIIILFCGSHPSLLLCTQKQNQTWLVICHERNLSLDTIFCLKETWLNTSINPPMRADGDITDLLPVWLQSAGCGGALVCKTPSDDTTVTTQDMQVSVIHTETLLFTSLH